MTPLAALDKIKEDLDRLRIGHPNCKAELCVPIRLAESRLALAEALEEARVSLQEWNLLHSAGKAERALIRAAVNRE